MVTKSKTSLNIFTNIHAIKLDVNMKLVEFKAHEKWSQSI